MFKRRLISFLKEWKAQDNRKPLILRGARQVGKTSLIKEFANQEYENFININLEKKELIEIYSKIQSVPQFIQMVQISLGKDIRKKKTLLFIDEIQNCPNLIELLRFFYEDFPSIHVIAAGSLLEKILEKTQPSIPVGRVSYAYLYPLDFFEFIDAIGETNLQKALTNLNFKSPINPSLNNLALKFFQIYLLIGGMPEIVASYAKDQDFQKIDLLFAQLLTSYTDDILKYASPATVKYIDHVLLNAHLVAGKIFRYSNFAGTNYSNKEMEPAFRSIEKVMILNQILATKSTETPLIGQLHRPKKLIHLDVGLVNYQANVRQDIFQQASIDSVFKGRIAEQIVGQNILAQSTYEKINLNYWALNKAESSAEVDFCTAYNGRLVGIEVKAGASGKLRSLFVFADKVKNHQLVRIHTGHLKLEDITFNKKHYSLLSLPVYLIPRLFEFLKDVNS